MRQIASLLLKVNHNRSLDEYESLEKQKYNNWTKDQKGIALYHKFTHRYTEIIKTRAQVGVTMIN